MMGFNYHNISTHHKTCVVTKIKVPTTNGVMNVRKKPVNTCMLSVFLIAVYTYKLCFLENL